MTKLGLPDAELELLAALRHSGEATAAELRRSLRPHRPLSHGSVMTLLGRLEERGLAERRKGPTGKAFLFRPTRRAGPAIRGMIGNLARRVFQGDKVSLVATLLESAPPDAADLDRLEEMVRRLRRGETAREEKP